MFCILIIWILSVSPTTTVAEPPPDGFADKRFADLWLQADETVSTGITHRSWIWGEQAGDRRYEQYRSANGSTRLVQYFDKARMEMPQTMERDTNSNPVTLGRLVVEMIQGQIQAGNTIVLSHPPADLPIAGDLHNNPAPTYAELGAITAFDGQNKAHPQLGQYIQTAYIDQIPKPYPEHATPETQIVHYEPVTGHNIPAIFATYMDTIAQIFQSTSCCEQIDSLSLFGFPITEPYWTYATIGGTLQPVLFQAFERRILTYTPSNPISWQVEMGNVGQHYFQWRYGRPISYTQPGWTGGVHTYETTHNIMTYDYASALVPTLPDDPIYPYPRINHQAIGSPQMQSYRVLVVENRFMQLTFLPELGGRLYQAQEKTSGRTMFYQNPVIKPSVFGQRGWWLAVGGIEWAAPTEEHGYLEYLPWHGTIDHTPTHTHITHEIREQQQPFHVAGSVSLASNESRFDVTMEVTNLSDTPQPLQMWMNAMLNPGGTERLGDTLRFVVPTQEMLVHATQDPLLPQPGELIPWPRVEGRDMSYPANWYGYVGVFTSHTVPFLGLYDSDQDTGVAVIHHDPTIGGKIFGFSQTFERSLYTDDNSEYVELWSGAQPTFWDYPFLAPGETRRIHTTWLPLWGLGELVTASAEGAIGMNQRHDGNTSLTIATTQVIPHASVIIRLDDAEIFRSDPLDLRPDQPLTIDLPIAISSTSRGQVEAPGLLLEW